MATQIQFHGPAGWTTVATLEDEPSAELLAAVRATTQPVRLWDAAQERVRVRSRGAPAPAPRSKGIERQYRLRLETASAVDQREPDPYSQAPSRSKRTRFPGRYPLFSKT